MARRRPGEGSILWNKHLLCWVGRLTVKVDGVSRRREIYGSRGDSSTIAKLGVEERLRALRGSKGDCRALGPFLSSWLETADLRRNTRATYTWASRHILDAPIARKRLMAISPSDVRAFYDGLDAGAPTKQKVHILLRRVLEEAVRLEVISRNPAAKITPGKVERKEIAIWTPEEVRKFLSTAKNHRLYALFLLSLTTTMGPAELFGLRWSDLHLPHGYLVVAQNLEEVDGRVTVGATKTKQRRRRIELPRITIEALQARKTIADAEGHRSPYVFSAVEGGPIRRSNFRRRVWIPLLKEAKVPIITLYGLRHTANALMGLLGVPIQLASARMGHASISTTADVYGHLYESQGREVAHLLDGLFSDLSKTRKKGLKVGSKGGR